MLIVFDVLAIDGREVTRRPCWEPRQLLEDLALEGDYWSTTPSHADGDSLWEAVEPQCDRGRPALDGAAESGVGPVDPAALSGSAPS
jgi:hypothetical protein